MLLAEWVQQSAVAEFLRHSIWLYPVINAAHIIGLALLFGATIPLDLRLLGCWPSMPIALLARVLMPVIVSGLAMAIAFGALLFITGPVDYLYSSVFIFKILLLSLALLNAFILTRAEAWRKALLSNTLNVQVRLQALLSIILWLAVIFLGRLIAYR